MPLILIDCQSKYICKEINFLNIPKDIKYLSAVIFKFILKHFISFISFFNYNSFVEFPKEPVEKEMKMPILFDLKKAINNICFQGLFFLLVINNK